MRIIMMIKGLPWCKDTEVNCRDYKMGKLINLIYFNRKGGKGEYTESSSSPWYGAPHSTSNEPLLDIIMSYEKLLQLLGMCI